MIKTGKVFIILLFIFTAYSVSGMTVYSYPESAPPGEIFKIIILSDSELEGFSAVLNSSVRSSIANYKSFSYSDPDFIKTLSDGNTRKINCIIITASFDFMLATGEYQITLSGLENGKKIEKSFRINLTDRSFKSINIALNENLSDLRTEVTDRRSRETRALMDQLAEFNTDSIYMKTGMMQPVFGKPVITSTFGERRKFIYSSGGDASAYHYGIDYAAETGTPVFAAAAGKVVFSGDRLITGNSVIIEHLPGLYSIYYHLSTIYAEKGAIVAKGDGIGTVGSTGLSTGPHLHWEIRNQLIPVDPDSMQGSAVIDKDEIISIINNDFSDKTQGR